MASSARPGPRALGRRAPARGFAGPSRARCSTASDRRQRIHDLVRQHVHQLAPRLQRLRLEFRLDGHQRQQPRLGAFDDHRARGEQAALGAALAVEREQLPAFRRRRLAQARQQLLGRGGAAGRDEPACRVVQGLDALRRLPPQRDGRLIELRLRQRGVPNHASWLRPKRAFARRRARAAPRSDRASADQPHSIAASATIAQPTSTRGESSDRAAAAVASASSSAAAIASARRRRVARAASEAPSEAMLVEPPVQRRAADAERGARPRSRCPAPRASRRRRRSRSTCSSRLRRRGGRRRRRRGRAPAPSWKSATSSRDLAAEDHGAFAGVAQRAHIAVPVVVPAAPAPRRR